jgi:hypothetical protein
MPPVAEVSEALGGGDEAMANEQRTDQICNDVDEPCPFSEGATAVPMWLRSFRPSAHQPEEGG